jgi:hypothetical protein
MVELFLSQWPISEGKGKYTDKATKGEIKTFLMDSEHRFTTTMPQWVAKASDALSKSKAPGTRTLGYQKEAAVQQAERAGEIQTSALFEQLEKGGISPMVEVCRIYISTAHIQPWRWRLVPQVDLVQTADNDNSCATSESGPLGTTIRPAPARNELADAC